MNRQYGNQVQFLAVNIAIGDTLDEIHLFMERVKGEVTVLYDENREVATSYKVVATPHIALIDKAGRIRSVERKVSVEDIRHLLDQ